MYMKEYIDKIFEEFPYIEEVKIIKCEDPISRIFSLWLIIT